MARYVTTKSATGAATGGSGGASGPTAAEVCQYACKAVCDLFCTNLITPSCRPTLNYLPTTDNCYTVICHCNCWTNCFENGCFKIDLDTNKYRGFRICFTGQRIKACCYNYFCAGIVSSNGCMCCCQQNYWLICACNNWPMGSCCFCYWCRCRTCGCTIGADQKWCYYCQSGLDGLGWFDFKLESAATNRPYCNCEADWMWDLCWMGHSYWQSDFPAQCNRMMGIPYCNKSTGWSKNQKADNYIKSICFFTNHFWGSSLHSGSYGSTACGDVNAPHPIPNWTIWGWPCCLPVNVGLWSGSTAPTANDAYE